MAAWSFALARFLPGWSLDHSFGRDGAVATDFGDGSVAYASALRPDGKVVAAGATGPGDLAAAKLPRSPWRVIYTIGVWTAAFGWNGVLASAFCLTARRGRRRKDRREAHLVWLALSLPAILAQPLGVKGPATTDF